MFLFSFFLLLEVFVSGLDLRRFRCEDDLLCSNIVCENNIACPAGSTFRYNANHCSCCGSCNVQKDDNLTPCRKNQQLRKELLSQKNDYADDLWIPECNKDGTYKLKQRRSRVSICMDSNGEKLFGKQVIGTTENMKCQCSLQHRQLPVTEEKCTSVGNFQRIQCLPGGQLCYCANPDTGEVEGRIVHKDHLDKLFCYQRNKSIENSCSREWSRWFIIRSHFQYKGLEVIGMEKVRCDPDGTFSPSQCDHIRCSCTDKNGVQLQSFYTDNLTQGYKMSCECARSVGNSFQCDSYGGYNRSQCFRQNECFCVDEEGEIISKRLLSPANCPNMLEHLTKLTKTDI